MMMLFEYTWSQFSAFALILTFLWYLTVCLVFFRKELKIWFRMNRHMGSMENADKQEHLFRLDAAAEPLSQVGQVPQGIRLNFIQEVQAIIQRTQEEALGRDVFLRRLQALHSTYPGIRKQPNWDALVKEIIHISPFPITREIITSLFH